MKHNKSRFGLSACVTSVLVLIFGLVLFIKPATATSLILNVLALALMLAGVFFLARYLLSHGDKIYDDSRLAIGLTLLVLGGVLMGCKRLLLSFVPMIFGLLLLLSGITKIQMSANMLRMEAKRWWLGSMGALISIVFALMIIFNPFGSAMTVVRVIGLALIVEAVQDLLQMKAYDNVIRTKFVD